MEANGVDEFTQGDNVEQEENSREPISRKPKTYQETEEVS